MGINQKIEYYRQQLINIINNSKLPVGILYYIIKDIFNMISIEYNAAIEREMCENAEEDKVQVEITQEDDGNVTAELTPVYKE